MVVHEKSKASWTKVTIPREVQGGVKAFYPLHCFSCLRARAHVLHRVLDARDFSLVFLETPISLLTVKSIQELILKHFPELYYA